MWERIFSIFTKIKNTDGWEKKKKCIFQLFHFRNSYFFLYELFHEMFDVSSEYSFNVKSPSFTLKESRSYLLKYAKVENYILFSCWLKCCLEIPRKLTEKTWLQDICISSEQIINIDKKVIFSTKNNHPWNLWYLAVLKTFGKFPIKHHWWRHFNTK